MLLEDREEEEIVENDILSNVWSEWHIVGKPIGKGAFGTVYKAERTDHQVNSEAAIKVITIPQDESEIKSLSAEGLSEDKTRTYFQQIVNDFVNEIQLMESLKGVQNIVSVEDYKVVEKKDTIGWDIYIRMELLTPLDSYLSGRILNEKEVIKLGCDICTALEHCAKCNVIHRDIKPENIFVSKFDDFKLGDFGIARSLVNTTNSLSQKGTYNYMAPEVEKGTKYDATVDIYSLGIVLYKYLNNNWLPFITSEQQLMNPNERVNANRRRLDGEPLLPPCNASPEMTDVILRACSPRPEGRYATATEMKRALKSVEDGTYISPEDLSKTRSMFGTVTGNAPQAAIENVVQQSMDTPENVQPASMEENVARKKRKSVFPKIAVFLLLTVVCTGGIIFAISKRKGKDPDAIAGGGKDTQTISASRPSSSSSEKGTDIKDTYSKSENKKIDEIIDKTDELAREEKFDDAVNKISDALKKYPDSRKLQEKLEEYIALQTQHKKESFFAEVEKHVAVQDYYSAAEVLKKALEILEEDVELRDAYNHYRQIYVDGVKNTAISQAEFSAGQKNYIEAIKTLENALKKIDSDEELQNIKANYEGIYVTDLFSRVDTLLSENNTSVALDLLQTASVQLPNNEVIKNRLKDMEVYKTVLLNSLSPINGGFNWNDGQPADPFGTSYAEVQNYAIFHAEYYAEDYSVEYKVDRAYQYLSFMVSPYSDFKQSGSTYFQVFSNGVLRYTSPVIYQKTQPFQTPAIDISDADYVIIKVHANRYGCIMFSDMMVGNSPGFESHLVGDVTSLARMATFNGSLPWLKEYPSDTTGSDYTNVQNYAVLHAEYYNEDYSAEYYVENKYKSVSLDIAPSNDFGKSGSAYIKIYADDALVYTSPKLTQKTGKFNTGKIDLTGVNYLKIVGNINRYGCTILSDVILENVE